MYSFWPSVNARAKPFRILSRSARRISSRQRKRNPKIEKAWGLGKMPACVMLVRALVLPLAGPTSVNRELDVSLTAAAAASTTVSYNGVS